MTFNTIKELRDGLKEANSTGRNLYFNNTEKTWLRVARISSARPARASVAVVHFVSIHFEKATVLLGGSEPAVWDIR